jgi:hypothetical protein
VLWVTRNYVHLDRVATPWLIARFVDPDARFCYVPWGQEHLAPADAIPLALPGAELGPHDTDACTFEKVLKKYDLCGSALSRLGRVIRAGIDYVLHDYLPGRDDVDGQIAVGLIAYAEGVMLVHQDDDAILAASFPVYDALYAHFSVTAHMQARGIVFDHKGGDGRGPSAVFEGMREIYNTEVVGRSRLETQTRGGRDGEAI